MPAGKITRSVTSDGHNVFSIYSNASPDKISAELVTNSKNQIVGVFSTDRCGIYMDMEVDGDGNFVKSASAFMSADGSSIDIDYTNPDSYPPVPLDDTQSLFFNSVVVAGNDGSQASSVIHRGGYDAYVFDTPRKTPDTENFHGIFIDINEESPPLDDVYIATRDGVRTAPGQHPDFMIIDSPITLSDDPTYGKVMQANGIVLDYADAKTASYQEGNLAIVYGSEGRYEGNFVINGDAAHPQYPALTPQTGEKITDAEFDAEIAEFLQETGFVPSPPTPPTPPIPDDPTILTDILGDLAVLADAKLTPYGIATALAAHSNKTANKRQDGFDAIMDAIEVLRDKKHGSWKKAIVEKKAASGSRAAPEVEMIHLQVSGEEERKGTEPLLARAEQTSGLEVGEREAKAVELLRFAKQKFDGGRRSIVGNDFAVNFAMAFDAYCEAEKITGEPKKILAKNLENFFEEKKSELDKRSFYPPVNPKSDLKKVGKTVAAIAAAVATKVTGTKYSQPVPSTNFDEIETWTQKGLDEKDYELINHHLSYAQAGLTSSVGNLAAESVLAKTAEKIFPGKTHHAQKSRDYGKDLRWYQALGHRLGGAFVDVFKVGNLEDNYEKLGRFTQAGRDLRVELALDDLQNLIAKKAKSFIEDAGETAFSKDEIDTLKKAHQKLSTFGNSTKSAENFHEFFELELKKVLAVFAENGVGDDGRDLTPDDVAKVNDGFAKLFTNSKKVLSSISASKDKKSFSDAEIDRLRNFEGVTLETVSADGALDGFVASEVEKLLECSKDRDNTLVRLAREIGIGGGVHHGEKAAKSAKATSAKALAERVLSSGRSGGGGGGGGVA